MTYVDLRPDHIREVQVLLDGTWWTGDLEAYRNDQHGWAGYVVHSTGPGSTFVGWHPEERLRIREHELARPVYGASVDPPE